MDFKLITILSATLAMLGTFIPSALAVTDTATVDVTVAASAEITVLPSSFTASSASIRADTASTNFVIKNTGTTNVTNTFAYLNTITVEGSNPLGTGAAAKYGAGSFIMLATPGNAYKHVGRLEWNLTAISSGMTCNTGSSTIWACGWYRNRTGDFLWSVENDTGTQLGGTGTQLRVANASESNVNTGTALQRDLSSGLTSNTYTPTANTGTGTTDFQIFEPNIATDPLNGYCVAARNDATRLFIYEYDKRTSPNFNLCVASSFVRPSALPPGEEQTFTLLASIPAGVPSNAATTQSTLTIDGTG